MNRRGFIRGLGALVAAPTVITTAGVFGGIIRPRALFGTFADGSPWILDQGGGVSCSVGILPKIIERIVQHGIDIAEYESNFDLVVSHGAGGAHLHIRDVRM